MTPAGGLLIRRDGVYLLIVIASGFITTPNGPLHWLFLSEAAAPSSIGDDRPAWLSAEEAAVAQALRTEKRRADWLLGRRAAKQLVAELVRTRDAQELPLDQIVILPHADGWPIVTFPRHGNLPAVSLSISHSHGSAFCAAFEVDRAIPGADIELIEPRSTGFAAEYFTPPEQSLLALAPAQQRVTLTNAIWSGKEAALKAIRRGLAEDTRLVTCLPHPLTAEHQPWLPMPIRWAEADGQQWPALAGRWRLLDQFVVTLAFPA